MAFDAALAAGESGEAWEGLSWAAWWLDEEDAVFAARERAFRLYRASGDVASAARMATWLASDALDFHGAAAVAAGWLSRAHRLLDPLEPGPAHGWLSFHDGYVARLRNETAKTLALAARTAEIGRTFAVPDLEMLGLALEGAVLVGRADVDRGMQCLDEATAIALEGEAQVPISSAWTCCFLVSACAMVRDYGRAVEWCDRIADFAERYGSRYMLGFCRAEYGEVHLWRGAWNDAEELLVAALDDFSASRPAWSGPPLVALAELRFQQGDVDEAAALLERAGTGERAQLCRARLALGDGRPADARRLLERALRGMDDRALARAPFLELLVPALLAQNALADAKQAVAELDEIAARVGTPALRAAVDRVQGQLDAACGDLPRALRHLEDAVDGFERVHAPYEAALARTELATVLRALGDDDGARSEARSACDELGRLGARAAADRARSLTDVPMLVTARERDVLGLVARGLTNRQIAEELVVSEHTVHRHVTNILRKLDLPSRAAAAAYAVRSGIVDVPTPR